MTMKKHSYEVIAVNKLKQYENNTRTHSEAQVAQIIESIKNFGFTNPVLIDEDNVIIAGHGRTEAAKKLGMAEVPCIRISGLTEVEVKALRIADNQLALNAGWDEELLKVELTDLADSNFDLDLLGFSPEELENYIIPTAEISADESEVDKEAIALDDLAQDKRMEAARFVFFAFSGGRDSTRALYLTAEKFKATGKRLEVIYIESTCEFPDLIMHIRRVCDDLGLPLKTIHPDKNFITEYYAKGKAPDSIFKDCVENLINKPMDAYIKTIVGDEDYILVRGGRASQKTTRSKTAHITLLDSKPNLIIYNPLFLATKEQLELPIPEWGGYEKGFDRTACWCCPFQKESQWEALRENYPLLWEEMRTIVGSIVFKFHEGDGFPRYLRYWERYGVTIKWDKACN